MKILVIRFSSMGDIIYTTPVVRCIKKQVRNAEVHFLTKPIFKYIYDNNPYLDKLLLLKGSLSETIADIKAEKYDHIVDLHSNLRTSIIKLRTGVKSTTYNKQRFKKWLSLKFKLKTIEPIHLVDRYLKAAAPLGVVNDGLPIDYYVKQQHNLSDLLPASHQKFVAFIIGATHFTKRMPNEKVISICQQLDLPVVLLGGKDVKANAEEIAKALGPKAYDACGVTSLDESVFLVSHAESIIGFDTGLTHIAEAFNKPIASIWGSTVPELLGVQPYKIDKSLVAGVELSCRPCSKFGLAKCPQGHFKCMYDIDEQSIVNFVNN
ncbi:glycosyltransferase family 9 protein [Mucilaginibacter myungsuensis]|uniref:Glycosyltransferase family 9 protein n=1 Tax=Mucilaginibacter myungsuensis TaxID=649104 RepID=A0A929PWS8_9SPHI|nr:glycosyltransferase family 9 protein [Mucilaginibacter myungsuensis]MBE9662449.1 glycosyltransferase family 9 protein [Mucilaginibacter myungsuensis]MDN3597869.1 glycosyltransferase family 9 protein [Mucilaginibacter myungsuensis]